MINSEVNMVVVGSAANGQEALNKLKNLKPDVVITDLQMPKLNGIDHIKELKTIYPELRIIILTTLNNEEFIIEGLAKGASGYLIRNTNSQLITNAIRDVMKGQCLLPIEVATKLAKFALQKIENEKHNALPKFIYSSDILTKKEQEIAALIVKRLTNKEMAKHLFITEGTLKNYLTVFYQKLGVKNRQQAITLLAKQE